MVAYWAVWVVSLVISSAAVGVATAHARKGSWPIWSSPRARTSDLRRHVARQVRGPTNGRCSDPPGASESRRRSPLRWGRNLPSAPLFARPVGHRSSPAGSARGSQLGSVARDLVSSTNDKDYVTTLRVPWRLETPSRQPLAVQSEPPRRALPSCGAWPQTATGPSSMSSHGGSCSPVTNGSFAATIRSSLPRWSSALLLLPLYSGRS